MKTKIKAIILDFGGVIFTGKLEDVQKEIAKRLRLPIAAITGPYHQHAYALVTGKLPAEEFAKQLAEKNKRTYEEVMTCWYHAYQETLQINPDILPVLESFRKEYIVTAITNTNTLHASINKLRGAYSCVDSIIISCDVGLAKPDAEIFLSALTPYHLAPEECIFVDDRSEHIAAASALGFHTITYEGVSGLIKSIDKIAGQYTSTLSTGKMENAGSSGLTEML